ncbi:MAG: ABC transporter permease [Bacteroidales bacterium]|nr:ABC transporter permease [Bacteroidales bacterium]
MHYLKISIRNLWRNRSTSIINLLGLTVALTSVAFIFLWVYNELSFDKYNENYENIYMLASEWNYSDGKSDFIMETPTPVGPYLKDNFPEVLESTRFAKQFGGRFLETNNKKFLEDGFAIEPSFFDIFTVDFISGDPSSIIDNPNSIFISQRLAKKFFGNENYSLNSIITFFINSEETIDYEVCGIYKDIPDNSSLQFDFLIPITFDPAENWYSFGSSTFLLLPNEIDIADLNNKIAQFYDYERMGFDIIWYLHSLKEMHFHSDFQQFVYHPGDVQYIYIFIIVGISILLIAVLNFMGLMSILISKRLKESGIRKISGASKNKVLLSLLAEPIILVTLAIYLTLAAIEILQSSFNSFSGKALPDIHQNAFVLTALIVLGLLIGIISGIVPGLFIASVNPFKALKQKQESRNGKLRKYLILVQFTLSIVLLSSTFLIQKQLNFIFNIDLGYNKENIIHIPLKHGSRENYSLLKQELLNNPMIKGVTNSSPLLSSGIEIPGWSWNGIGNEQKHSIARIQADCDFVESFEIALIQGENFSAASINTNKAIINEEAALSMNMANPIHQHFQLKGQDYEIIGMVENFHSRHFSNQIRPTMISYQESGSNLYVVYKNNADREKIILTASSIFKKYNPEIPFEYTYFTDDFARIYRDESQMLKLLFYFVIVAFLILCFGLYGLSRQVAIHRTKEIGIRKVNGATISEILLMLGKDFAKWVIIAFIIATPIAYLMMQKWLHSFVYKTTLSWWVFALAGVLALLIALITVCWQSWSAAVKNPVDSLRYE